MAKGHVLPRNLLRAAVCVCVLPGFGFLGAGDGWSVDGGRSGYTLTLPIPAPRPGDVFGIYYTDLKHIAHVGFVDGWGGKYCTTVERNTGPDGALPPPTSSRFASDGLVGYASSRQAAVSTSKSQKRSGSDLPETVGNGLQGIPHNRTLQIVNTPANPIRAGPPVDGVYRKRRPVRTIYAVARGY